MYRVVGCFPVAAVIMHEQVEWWSNDCRTCWNEAVVCATAVLTSHHGGICGDVLQRCRKQDVCKTVRIARVRSLGLRQWCWSVCC